MERARLASGHPGRPACCYRENFTNLLLIEFYCAE